MALIQHNDEKIRFQQQVDNAKAYVLPFIEEAFPLKSDLHILDIGCGDGGVMLPFLEMGIKATGIELDQQKAVFAKTFLSNYITSGQAEIINLNIYEAEALVKYKEQFDLIILKDVIEHIFDQDKFIPYLKQFLKPGGRVYFGFPPWYMPHGGHQQVCQHKLLAALPYYHLLPVPLYKFVLKAFGERNQPKLAWLLIFLNQLWITLAVYHNENFDFIHCLIFFSGIFPAFILGYIVLYLLSKREPQNFSLNMYYGHSYEYGTLSLLFLLSCLGLMGFPITMSFIGEDLILSHIHDADFLLSILVSLSFIMVGIALMRMYARLFLGPHIKTYHATPFKNS
jgi:SAM-dependent methyltransferase